MNFRCPTFKPEPNENIVKITERGWPGHFCAAQHCLFRRNTLIEFKKIKIIVSTVGNWRESFDKSAQEIGHQRYYETMAFHGEDNGKYIDVNIHKSVSFHSPWSISKINKNSDNKANEMHETVVQEIAKGLSEGKVYAEDLILDF